MVQRNCELFCQIALFYAAHAVSDGGIEIYYGKARVLVCIKNWIGEVGDWLFLILIAVWFQTATAINEINFEKARVFQTQKLFQFASKTEEEKNSFMFRHIITSYPHHILFTYIEVLHPAELRTLCHSSLSNFPSPFLSALANILATWKVKVKLKTVVKVLHESKSLLLQTSWLPATWEQYWKLRQKCIRESESLRSYLQTFWLPVKWKWFRKWMWNIWLPATWKRHWNWMWK